MPENTASQKWTFPFSTIHASPVASTPSLISLCPVCLFKDICLGMSLEPHTFMLLPTVTPWCIQFLILENQQLFFIIWADFQKHTNPWHTSESNELCHCCNGLWNHKRNLATSPTALVQLHCSFTCASCSVAIQVSQPKQTMVYSFLV